MATPARRRRVLLVDDSRETSRALSRIITLLGHDVRTARDGPDAVEAESAFGPEAVLMDIGLPGLDGYEAARRIRDQPWGMVGPIGNPEPLLSEMTEPLRTSRLGEAAAVAREPESVFRSCLGSGK